MELLPLGPVMMMDTPGMDDEGTLGELRIKRTLEVLKTIDLFQFNRLDDDSSNIFDKLFFLY